MRKPTDVTYWLEDRPPVAVLVSCALQQAAIVLVFLFPAILLARALGAHAAEAASIIGLTLVASAFGTVMQALGRGGIGGGYLAPIVPATAFVVPTALAAEQGGLPLVAGMTLVTGVAMLVLARGLHTIRALIPPAVAGAVVFMVGLSIALGGSRALLSTAGDGPPATADVAVAALTFAIAVALSIWGRGILRYACVLLAMTGGTVAAALLGRVGLEDPTELTRLPLVGLPQFGSVGFAFDAAMLPAFLVASLASALKTVGVMTQLQQMNDADWTHLDPRGPARGVTADGVTTLLSGLLGTPPQNTSSTNATIQQATGVTSRAVGYATAAVCLIVALSPRGTALLSQVPIPVIAATLLHAGGLMLVNGMQMATSRLLDTRKTVAIGIGIATAVTIETAPRLADWLPQGLRPLLTATAIGTIVAIVLNAMLRVGIRREVSLVLPVRVPPGDTLWDFVLSAGAGWGARREVVSDAATAAAWCIEAIEVAGLCEGDITVTLGFDEHRLDLRVVYPGRPIEPSDRPPRAEELLTDDGAAARLAGHMIRRLAQRLTIRARGGVTELRLSFDH